ncbi:hypothetical protein [Nonomuraea sp. NPDC049141]|uniref:hypothetical protein n=1 Tax=Nonomuraea sp. NPDC049141 TaxID=3155500 RepID=UPI0033FCEAB0
MLDFAPAMAGPAERPMSAMETMPMNFALQNIILPLLSCGCAPQAEFVEAVDSFRSSEGVGAPQPPLPPPLLVPRAAVPQLSLAAVTASVRVRIQASLEAHVMEVPH